MGGRDIRAWTAETLRRQVGIVLQDPCSFSGSIADKIGLNDAETPPAAIRKAAENAHLAQHIAAFPNGYDEPVLERAAGLSTGQKQLVGFSRALARERPFLVLDEATSSVDPENETDIQDTRARLVAGRTSIVIAHRLSTLRQADRIVVLH